jgi:hypothetical protein
VLGIGSRQKRAGHESGHDAGRREDGMRRGDDLDAAGRDGLADGVRIGLRVDERIGRSELLEAMHVAVADHRLAVPARPPFREGVVKGDCKRIEPELSSVVNQFMR